MDRDHGVVMPEDPPPACGCGRAPVAYAVRLRGGTEPAGYCCRVCAADGVFRREADPVEMSDGDWELALVSEVMGS